MDLEDFFTMVEIKNTCWEWTGTKAAKSRTEDVNYGSYKGVLAHRFSYEIHIGKIPEKSVVRHICDNPCCVNPNHLVLGSNKENSQDMALRRRSTFGERNHHAILTKDKVTAILAYKALGRRNKELSDSFGISQQTICDISKRRSWKNTTLDHILGWNYDKTIHDRELST